MPILVQSLPKHYKQLLLMLHWKCETLFAIQLVRYNMRRAGSLCLASNKFLHVM